MRRDLHREERRRGGGGRRRALQQLGRVVRARGDHNGLAVAVAAVAAADAVRAGAERRMGQGD